MARQPKKKPEFVRITAVSAEATIENSALTFEPPLIDCARSPESFEFWWRMLQYVFPDIADPYSFPPLTQPLDPNSLEVCRRYVAAAEEMAESQLLGADDQFTVHFGSDSDEESIEAITTSKEITRGFSALLRQFDSQGEPARARGTCSPIRSRAGP